MNDIDLYSSVTSWWVMTVERQRIIMQRIAIGNEYSSRYLLYCKAHGNEGNPGRQLEEDSMKWPGGKMCGFILWIQAKWHVFGVKYNVPIDYRTMYQKDFDTWLTSEV